ncbi:MAG: HEPN domain-containing protein [Nanoarchaeota archaeon]
MKFNVNKLIEMELLKRIPASKQKAEESIKSADSWFREAKNNLKGESFASCILTSYLAMFHAARAILFADGFREKSHFAIARYLEDKYMSKGMLEKRWIELLDYYREIRHDDQYSTSFMASNDEARNALKSAKEFVERMKRLLNK